MIVVNFLSSIYGSSLRRSNFLFVCRNRDMPFITIRFLNCEDIRWISHFVIAHHAQLFYAALLTAR